MPRTRRPHVLTGTRAIPLIAGVAIAALALGSCQAGSSTATRTAPAHTDGSTAPSVAPSTAPETDTVVDVAAMEKIVAGIEKKHPDATVTSAVAVRTDRSRLLALTGDAEDPSATGVPVIVLQLRGTFPTPQSSDYMRAVVARLHGKTAPGMRMRNATAITMSFGLDLQHVLDAATQYPGNRLIDLSKLDAPVVDIPLEQPDSGSTPS